ncbi:acetylcholinesterase-like [Ruditapes philippinarum]|uniref:acetylcholinesterase-like n=1 Tax=Ruditapes philippinarum TaxID=129788 RepID=UPI00295A913D|nr:acetylcholinesterase-like [Ruditapes philippinarum]
MISAFAPRVDGYYIHDLPEVLLARGEYIRYVNVLNGFLPDEVSEDFESEPGIDDGLSMNHLEQLFYTKSRRYLTNADDIFAALKCAYPPSNSDKTLNRDHLINMNSDYGYVAPHIKLSQKLSAKGENVWMYEFTYRSANSLKKPWIGVPHSEELCYQFGAPFLDVTPCPNSRNVTCPVTWGKNQNWSIADKQVSLETMKLWAGFAKLKQNSAIFPSSDGSHQNWSQYSPGENILNISTAITQEHLRKTNGVRFWESFNYLNLSEHIPDVCHSESSILVGK